MKIKTKNLKLKVKLLRRNTTMRKQRKTDKYKLKENRGTGRGEQYIPWIKPHEFSSSGRVHRVRGWKVKRMHVLLSDLELYYFLILQWSDKVVDIREQFPLLPMEQTKAIAERLVIKHPAINGREGDEVIMTTDFLITIKEGDTVRDIVRTAKMAEDLSKQRVKEKFLIEKEYWKTKGIDWGVVSEKEINRVFARNIWFIYQDYFWDEKCPYSTQEIDSLISEFKPYLKRNGENALNATLEFEKLKGWMAGEGLNFLKYLIAKKKIRVDLTRRLNFKKLRFLGDC